MPTVDPMAPETFPADDPTKAYLGDSGIVFGETDSVGVAWEWTTSGTWGPSPAPREETGDRAFADGQWDATRFYGPRTLPVTVTAKAPTHVALHQAQQRLRDAVGVTPFEFRVTEPGFDGYAVMRQQGEILWTEINPLTGTATIALYGRDPLIYSSLERVFDIGFGVTEGGLEWPVTWPATWDGTSSGGTVSVLNPSSRPVPLKLQVYGPVDNFRVVNLTTNDALVVNNPDGSTLTGGQFLTIDTASRQVLLQGTAGRRSWASGDWPLIPPGVSVFAITGDNTTIDSHVSGTYRGVRL